MIQVNDILSYTNKSSYTTTIKVVRLTEKCFYAKFIDKAGNILERSEHRRSFLSVKDWVKIKN